MADARSLAGSMASGATWMIAMRLADRSIGVVSMLILARLLFPADFGLVATATAIVSSFEVLSEFSFDLALIQNQRADRADYDTAWTLGLMRGLLLATGLLLFAGPIAAGFNEPRLEAILRILAAVSIIQDAINIGTVDFRRDLHFSKEFNFTFWPRLCSFCATIVSAYLLRNYWALVIGISTRGTVRLLLSYMMSAYRPRLSLARVHRIMNFSKWIFFTSVFNIINVKSPTMILGWISGARVVGFYALSFEISNIATSELVNPIGRALFPAYSKMADQIDEIRKAYLGVIALIVLFAAPIAVGLCVTAETAIPVLLGSRWTEAVPVVEVLAISGLVQLLGANAAPVYLALGRPRLLTFLSGMSAAIGVPLYILGAMYDGMFGMAAGLLIVTVVRVSMNLAILFRVLTINLVTFLKAVWRAVASVAVMGFVVYQAQLSMRSSLAPDWLPYELAVFVMLGAAVYFAVTLGIWLASGRPDGSERILLTWLREKLQRFEFVRSRLSP